MKLLTKLLIVALILVGGIAITAKANGLYFVPTVQTATATTTLSTVNPSSTVTLTLDTYLPGNPTGIMGGALLLQGTGSTSASVVTVAFEYSQDGVDWYSDSLTSYATSTTQYSMPTNRRFISMTGALQKNAIAFTSPTRWVRAQIGGVATSTVWAQIVPAKEVKE